MKVSTKTAFVTASTVAAFLLLLFKGGVATGTMMSGGVMRSADVSGAAWFVVSSVLFIALAAAIFSMIFWNKQGSRHDQSHSAHRVR